MTSRASCAVVWIADDALFHATCSRLGQQGFFLVDWAREHVICESRAEMHRQVERRAREAGFDGGTWEWHQTPHFLEEHFKVGVTMPRRNGG